MNSYKIDLYDKHVNIVVFFIPQIHFFISLFLKLQFESYTYPTKQNKNTKTQEKQINKQIYKSKETNIHIKQQKQQQQQQQQQQKQQKQQQQQRQQQQQQQQRQQQ